MKRSNTSLVISLVIHVLAALIFAHVHREGIVRRGSRAIPVEFNVKAPEPRLEMEKPKLHQTELNPELRPVSRLRSPRFVKIDKKMDRTTAYRDIIVTEDSESLPDMDVPQGDLKTGGSFTLRSGARGAGRTARGGGNQLVEFVDRARGKRRIVYCIDVSASMAVSNKLNLARGYLKDSLFALNESRDKFNIIAFADSPRIFHSGGLVPATRENLADATGFLDEYTPQGIRANRKTDLLSALMRALDMRPNIVVLVTDGLPTAGVTDPERILQTIREKNTDGNVRIFAIGMEMEMDQPEAWLLRTIAQQNNGEYQFL